MIAAPQGTSTPEAPAGPEALRAEHDALAGRLATRFSIDYVRRAAYGGFFALVLTGVTIKLAVDRWFSVHPKRFKGPPAFFFTSLALALLLAGFTLAWYLRARRLMKAEDRDFARLQELRRQLELDP